MTAKMISKARKNRHPRLVEPESPVDLDNMRLVLRLKLQFHPKLKAELLATGEAVIIEDCSPRKPSGWGCQRIDGEWVGENPLGKLWMELRGELQRECPDIQSSGRNPSTAPL